MSEDIDIRLDESEIRVLYEQVFEGWGWCGDREIMFAKAIENAILEKLKWRVINNFRVLTNNE